MIKTTYHEVSNELFDRFKHIKLIISDVDGVLSDGKIYMTEHGDEIKSFNAKDGCGIVSVIKQGIEFAVITGRSSTLLAKRMADLKVKYVYQAVTDKVEKYREMIQQLGLVPEETLYIGDDVIDLPLLGSVGISVAVADAHPLLLDQVDLVTKNIGGSGAVREITDIVLQAQGKLSIIEGSI